MFSQKPSVVHVCVRVCVYVSMCVREKYTDIYKNRITHIKAFIKKSHRYQSKSNKTHWHGVKNTK